MNDWLPNVDYEYKYNDFHRLLSEKLVGSKFSGTDVRVASNGFAGDHPHAVKWTSDGQFGSIRTRYDYDANGNMTDVYRANYAVLPVVEVALKVSVRSTPSRFESSACIG